MSIKQINATFLVNEDRILFRFNTQDQSEYQLWFTRRVTLFILAASSHLLAKNLEQKHSPDAAKALNKFANDAVIENEKAANTDVQNYQSGTQFPLGSGPLLVMDVTCSLAKNDTKIDPQMKDQEQDLDHAISIDFALPGGANLNLQLPANMMRAMSILLDQLRQQAGWGEAILSVNKQSENISKNDADNGDTVGENSIKNISLH